MAEKIVLVTDYTWSSTEPEAEVLAQAGARLLIAETASEAELLELVPPVDAIMTTFAQVPASVVRAGTNLQVIGRFGSGVDNIPVSVATKLGLPVTNVPVYCTDEVAEHALAFLLMFARKTHLYNAAIRQNNWKLQTGMPLHRVNGQTLGIIGFGNIGQALAGKARGLGLQILVYDRKSDNFIRGQHAEPVSLDELLARSDFASLHLPLTPETRGLLDASRLRQMKPSACLINVARGSIVDSAALLQALQEKWIAGAAVDVFDPEPLPDNHPLLEQPALIASPHVAFYSEESIRELEIKAAQNVAAILSGRRPAHVVNPEVLALPRWAHLT
jgi:D-3-phosphoglycerate dehydrogenase